MNFAKKLRAAVFSVSAALGATSVSAAPIALDENWAFFDFDGPGSSWTLEFVVSGAGYLQVTDYLFAGDQFEVFSDGISLGLTSAPTSTTAFTRDLDAAFADAQWSSGEFELRTGIFNITGTAPLSPRPEGGTGAVRWIETPIDIAPVPLPAAGWMLLAGFGGMAALRRRHKV